MNKFLPNKSQRSMQTKAALDRAGGVAFIASHFGMSFVSVYEWIKRGSVPPERCPEIEKVSAGAARCEDLNESVDWAFLRTGVTNPPNPAPSPAATLEICRVDDELADK